LWKSAINTQLMQALDAGITSTDKQSYFTSLLEFEKEKSDSIIKTESLSLLTMPETVASSIIARIGKTGNNFYEYQKNRIQLFEDNIALTPLPKSFISMMLKQ
jgi:hypothetical protein